MSDELMERLSRLAPDVDTDAAFDALGQPPGRRNLVLMGAGLAVVVAVVAAAAFAFRGEDDKSVTAGPSTTPAVGVPLSTTTTQDGIELTVTLPAGEVRVGTRVRAEVKVRNVDSVPILWQAGGCAIPAPISLRPVDPAPVATSQPKWDGVTPLADWLRSGNAQAPLAFVDPSSAGVRFQACSADSRFATISPGGAATWAGVADVRIPPGPLAGYEVVATFTGFAQPSDYPDAPRPPVKARLTVPLVEDAARAASAGDAVAAFAADSRLRPFLDRTAHELDGNPIPVTQSWYTELSWWQGAWELWVTPYFNGDSALRLRYEPGAGQVIDARLTSPGAPPGDDPDHNSFPGQTPDTVLPAQGE
jgi:hypothetical protein